jgi:tetratricopeptide (TPR) repeat protein
VDARASLQKRDANDVQAQADLAFARASLSVVLQQDGKHSEGSEEADRALSAARAAAGHTDAPPGVRVKLASVYASVAAGEADANRLDRARAIAAEARAALILADASRDALDARSRDLLGDAHFNAAALAFRTEEWGVAIENLQTDVALRRAQLARAPGHAGFQLALATALGWLGQAQERRYEDREALAADTEALQIERALVQRDPENVWAARELASNLVTVCLLGREWDGPAAADPSCAEAREASERLAKAHPRDRTSLNLLARSLKGSGESALAAHRNEEARGFFEGAVDASRRALERAPQMRDMQQELAACIEDLGRAHAALGHADEARTRYREALGILEPQLAASADESSQVYVGELAMLLGDTERGDAAHADYARAVDLFRKAHAGDPGDLEPAIYLAKGSLKLAAVESDPRTKAELLRQANEVLVPHLAAGRVSPEWRAELAAAGK